MAEEVKNSEQTEKAATTDVKASEEKKHSKCFFANNKHAAMAFVGVVGVIIGLVIGLFMGGTTSPLGVTTVPESKLDETIATYKYNGTHKATIREIMEDNGSVDFYKTTDEKGQEVYHVPSSEVVANYVRSQVILDIANEKGIKVTDEEVTEALNHSYHVANEESLASMAKQIGSTPEKIKQMITNQLKKEKLVMDLMGDDGQLPDPPAKPEAPAEGEESEATAAYADYIRNIVGSAWNNETKQWADENSPYAKTLVGENAFDGEKATYSQANVVFSIAAQNYQDMVTKGQTKAFDTINNALANTSLTVRTLAQ